MFTSLHVKPRGNVSESCAGNFSPAMGARNQVGIGLSYLPASLCSLATQLQTRFLELIPRPTAGLKFSTQMLFTYILNVLFLSLGGKLHVSFMHGSRFLHVPQNINLIVLVKETVSRVLSVSALIINKVYQNFLTTLHNYKLFICLFAITY